MNYKILTYSLYVVISILLTVWVARTLHRNGRIFLISSFHGNEPLADSVNHLLVVGFYLVNLGFVAFYLKLPTAVESGQTVFEALGGKLGTVMLALGVMHFFNIFLFHRMRRRGMESEMPPPVKPEAHLNDLLPALPNSLRLTPPPASGEMK